MQAIKPLPKFYLITPDFTGDEKNFLAQLELSLENGVRLVQLRSKNLDEQDYIKLANAVLSLTRLYQATLLLNGAENLLTEVAADGIHLPAQHYRGLNQRSLSHDYILSVACHNPAQLQQAANIEADLAVLCPIFSTPSSPQGIPIGWSQFAEFIVLVNFPVYALGGLSIADYEVACRQGAYGIAAKRALWGLREKL